MPAVYLHHNRGVPALRFTVRVDREIRLVKTQPFNTVAHDEDHEHLYLVTKGRCEQAMKLGRLRLHPYTGRFPRLALIWQRFKEVIND
ncbi:hypothetical protein [Pseudomonas sp. B14(2017)]|uniref:hypothetical protein n=1 Tax=Pseudomonas sp. B14(2017) TaxID=1981745 RepID=UPI000A1F7DF9|nr:hypothetical protein [Pseudomonas sp. B14(2017)]